MHSRSTRNKISKQRTNYLPSNFKMVDRIPPILINIYLLILTIVYIISIPLVLLIVLPFYLSRIIVKFLALQLKSNELCSLVSPRNTIFAVDNVFKSPTANVVVCITLEGILNLSKLQEAVLHKIVLKKNKQGKLCYPELQQCLTTWLGFYFWKPTNQFRISSHVKMMDSSSLTEFKNKDLCEIQEILIRKPFEKSRSPWEFLLMHFDEEVNPIPNERRDKNSVRNQTVFFFRVHHSLADGFSILKMLMSDLSGQELVFPPIKRNSSFLSKLALKDVPRLFSSMLKIPYDQVKQRHYSKDSNVWHNKTLKLSRKYHAVVSEHIPVSRVKHTKEKYTGSTFTTIILDGVTSGIRKYFLESQFDHEYDTGSVLSLNQQIPDHIHTICPMPMPGYPETLGNHWAFCFVKLPTGVDNSIKRLRQINESINSVKSSNVVQTNFGLISIVGILSNGMIRQLTKNVFSTAITSIFPGPLAPCIICGHLVTNMVFAGGLLHGDQGICLTLISYNGKFQIFLMVDQAIISTKRNAKQLLNNIYNSIVNLDTIPE